jgi:hypothetical protein
MNSGWFGEVLSPNPKQHLKPFYTIFVTASAPVYFSVAKTSVIVQIIREVGKTTIAV